MHTNDVWEMGQILSELKPILKDVCPADYIPSRIRNKPSAYIVNDEDHQLPGSHWLAFYFPEEGPCEFFDSAGQKPEYYQERFRRVLIGNGPGYVFNDRVLQNSESYTCGLFTLYFLWRRCQGYSMRDIVEGVFSEDVENNEQIVVHFLEYKGYTLSRLV